MTIRHFDFSFLVVNLGDLCYLGYKKFFKKNNNTNYNKHDNVYAAIIGTKVIARVHPVH